MLGLSRITFYQMLCKNEVYNHEDQHRISKQEIRDSIVSRKQGSEYRFGPGLAVVFLLPVFHARLRQLFSALLSLLVTPLCYYPDRSLMALARLRLQRLREKLPSLPALHSRTPFSWELVNGMHSVSKLVLLPSRPLACLLPVTSPSLYPFPCHHQPA